MIFHQNHQLPLNGSKKAAPSVPEEETKAVLVFYLELPNCIEKK